MKLILTCLSLVFISITEGLHNKGGDVAGSAERINPFQDRQAASTFLLKKRVKRDLFEECSEVDTCSYEETREHNYSREDACELFKQWKCVKRGCGVGYYCDTWNDNGCQSLSKYRVHCYVRRTKPLIRRVDRPSVRTKAYTISTRTHSDGWTAVVSSDYNTANDASHDSTVSWMLQSATDLGDGFENSSPSWISNTPRIITAVSVTVMVFTLIFITCIVKCFRKNDRKKNENSQNQYELQSSKENKTFNTEGEKEHVYDQVNY